MSSINHRIMLSVWIKKDRCFRQLTYLYQYFWRVLVGLYRNVVRVISFWHRADRTLSAKVRRDVEHEVCAFSIGDYWIHVGFDNELEFDYRRYEEFSLVQHANSYSPCSKLLSNEKKNSDYFKLCLEGKWKKKLFNGKQILSKYTRGITSTQASWVNIFDDLIVKEKLNWIE